MSSFVVAFRRAGSNSPLPLPSVAKIIDFQSDGDGGAHYLYEFKNADMAAGHADLVKGETFTDVADAARAYREAVDG